MKLQSDAEDVILNQEKQIEKALKNIFYREEFVMNIHFQERRQQLLCDKKGPCMLVIFSGKAPMRSADEAYPFVVDRDFYYLTGIDRENMILVMTKDYAGNQAEMLYIEPYDEFKAKWVGGRMKADEATAISEIQDIRYLENFDSAVNSFVDRNRGEGKMTFYLDLWKHNADQLPSQAHLFAQKVQANYPAAQIDEIFGDIVKMRVVKSEAEIEKMRVAQETTRRAIEAMMKFAYPGVNECALEGAFDFELAKQGVKEHAFPSIVAGGARATTLHYSTNNQNVQDNEMVLIDLGSANEHYCADISRTFPVNGKFTERQKEVYNVVLAVQQLIIDSARPGMTMLDLNNMVIEFYEKELPKIGLLKDGKTVRDYYYHSVSHSLGLDCHDVVTPALRTLRPGMVITVEPGLYIAEEGIGVRIEDDILITEEKAINLSENILKTVEDIEALMKK